MSVAELKKEAIRRIERVEDEALLKQVVELVKLEPQKLSAQEIFDYTVEKYGNTLKRLAE